MRYKVKKDCFCEHYLHEKTHYPRKMKERKLKKGEIVEFVQKWTNLYGTYIRVRKGNNIYHYDILPENLEEYYAEYTEQDLEAAFNAGCQVGSSKMSVPFDNPFHRWLEYHKKQENEKIDN